MTQQTYIPDWSKAPEGANWHARDQDGCGFWYNKRPAQSRGFWAAGGGMTAADNDCAVLEWGEWLDDWQDTLTARPYQNSDIPQNLHDYFSGKTSFITTYVDLLLARMANENRFSDDKGSFGNGCFDIVSFDYEGFKHFGISLNSGFEDEVIYLGYVICLNDTNFTKIGSFELKNVLGGCRTITELEAVEFRKAMEAVYGD